MADKKISALTSATTPLAGTEVLPIVQSSSTVKVAVSDLTTGRNVTAANFTASSTTTNAGVFADYNSTNVGRMVAASNGNLYFGQQTGSGTVSFGTSANGDLIFLNGTQIGLGTTSTTETVNFGGNAKLNTGNVVIGTAGKGIDFSANANAPGMTSELLDWYEEGTWAIADVSGAGLSLTIDHAKYTRVGNLVTINAYVTYPVTADTSAATLSLPFAAAAYDLGSAGASNGAVFSIITTGGTNAMSLRSSSLVSLTNAAVSGANVLMSFTYMV